MNPDPASPLESDSNLPAKAKAPVRPPGPRLMFVLLMAAILGPWVWLQGPVEVARWHWASAIEQREARHDDVAYQRLEQALTWSPNEPGLFMQRASWKMDDGQYAAALDDCERAGKLLNEIPAGMLLVRSQIYQHLGRHAEAIKDLQTVDQLSQTTGTPPRSSALNARAYGRAVGNLELEQGLADVNAALEFLPDDPMILDTRGFLLYRLEKYDEALEDMDKSIAGLKSELAALTDETKVEPHKRRLGMASDRQSIETRKQGLAVIHYHRALVLQKLGRSADAEKDLAIARKLIGREPDEKLF